MNIAVAQTALETQNQYVKPVRGQLNMSVRIVVEMVSTFALCVREMVRTPVSSVRVLGVSSVRIAMVSQLPPVAVVKEMVSRLSKITARTVLTG